MKFRMNNRGDTIVEVMIVLAVLGLAISISYATANKSLLAVRAAQESAKANELLRSQLELIRALSVNGTAITDKNVFTPGPFCIDVTDLNNLKVVPVPPGPPVPPCFIDSLYSVSIAYVNNLPRDPSTFTLKVTWPDVSGSGDSDSASMSYRLYP